MLTVTLLFRLIFCSEQRIQFRRLFTFVVDKTKRILFTTTYHNMHETFTHAY